MVLSRKDNILGGLILKWVGQTTLQDPRFQVVVIINIIVKIIIYSKVYQNKQLLTLEQ